MKTKSLTLALTAFCLLAASAAAADDPVPSFKKRGDMEKKFVSEVCVAILKAAHPTGSTPSLDKYEFKDGDKPNRKLLVIKGNYKGLVTRKVYSADITLDLETSNKDSWEVLKIDYTDNNNIAQNRKNLDALLKKLNQ